MTTHDVLAWLAQSTLATSAAIALVLLARRPLRAAFGSRAVYAAWGVVPLALVGCLLPARTVEVALSSFPVAAGAAVPVPLTPAPRDLASLFVAAWALGGIAFFAWSLWRQHRFVRGLGALRELAPGVSVARASAGLPAVVGLRARIVLPDDFEARYSPRERELVLAHERVHVRRRDVPCNTLCLLLRAGYWFNPLLWLAAGRFRHDQELACDQAVIARYPKARRRYGEAMMKTLSPVPRFAPMACQWLGGHPLKERIMQLGKPVPTARRATLGLFVAATLGIGASIAAWAAQPARQVASPPAGAVVHDAGKAQGAAATPITISAKAESIRDVARRVAGKAHLRIANLERLPGDKRVTLHFEAMPARTIMEVLADAGGLATSWNGDVVSFVALPAPSPANASVTVVEPKMPPPKYPQSAIDNKIEGSVILLVDVAADGTPTDVQVAKSEPQGVFDAATIAAAKQWKFKPAMRDGKPVAGRVRVPVWFDLQEGKKHAPPPEA